MKLRTVELSRKLVFAPVKGRIVELEYDTGIRLYTDEGIYDFLLLKGFRWNGRSGGFAADLVAPNQGTQMEAAMWGFHDASGYPDTISPKVSGELLRQFAMLMCGYGPKRAGAIKVVVNALEKSWKAYDWEEVAPEWICNQGKIKFQLSPR